MAAASVAASAGSENVEQDLSQTSAPVVPVITPAKIDDDTIQDYESAYKNSQIVVEKILKVILLIMNAC